MKEAVVCVHGLFMNGLDMALLRHRIARSGYDVYQFRYPSRHRSARQNAAYLNDFVQQLPHGTVHFVCHSLGGLVIRHYFQNFQAQRPGRVLTMAASSIHDKMDEICMTEAERFNASRWRHVQHVDCIIRSRSI